MVRQETWQKIEGTKQEKRWFPKYFVSQPPHRNTLSPIYYKVTAPNGYVFWRKEGDDTGSQTSFYDLLMEEMNGRGLQRLDKEYTPWAED